MKYLFLLLLFGCFNAFGQTPSEINKAIGLPDSLIYMSEIRVYKHFGYTNRTDVFRIYSENDTIKSEVYNYNCAVPYYNVKEEFSKELLKAERNTHLIWVDIMNTYIDEIPNQGAIRYKLKTKFKVVSENDNFEYSTTSTLISDGVSYYIFVKFGNKNNVI
jgi:hypothetical protein